MAGHRPDRNSHLSTPGIGLAASSQLNRWRMIDPTIDKAA
jgi:hypothetical protein